MVTVAEISLCRGDMKKLRNMIYRRRHSGNINYSHWNPMESTSTTGNSQMEAEAD
jgi:hypothetical protein